MLNTTWSNCRYQRKPDGTYWAHSPIYGPARKQGTSERGVVARYIRIENVLSALQHLGITREHCLLDVGCSEGHFLSLARAKFNCEIVGTDISSEACDRAQEIHQVNAFPLSVTDLKFENHQFDYVVCMETLEHIPDVHKAIEEILRVARCGVVITVPNESVRKTARTHLGIRPMAHLWNFKHNSFDFLKDMGYQVKVVRHTSTVGLCLYMALEKLNLLNNPTLRFCLKLDRLIQHIPPSWGWMFVITKP